MAGDSRPVYSTQLGRLCPACGELSLTRKGAGFVCERCGAAPEMTG